MFRSLQCVQKGRVHMPDDHNGAAVYADDYGGAWVVSDDGQEVYYYTAHTLASSMELQHSALPSYTSPSVSSSLPASSPPTPYTLAFRCGEPEGVAEIKSLDKVHSVLFLNTVTSVSTALQPRRDVCVVTEGGTVAFLRVPAPIDEPPLLLQPFQEMHIELRVTATTATANAVILCCFDGKFAEVVRTVLMPAATVSSNGLKCPHQSDTAMTDALCTCAVEATGLFRVQGRILCILYDGVHEALIAVNDAGNVDVWDVASGRDVTAQFGSPAWDTAKHGSATCAILCRDKLWIGLSSGQLLIFPFVSADRLTEAEAVQRTLGDTTAGLLLRSHSSPITGMIPVSLQSSVWSCAAGNGKVNVWDATDAAFRGSFVFPKSGIQSWYPSVAQLRGALWGIDGASGEPCLVQVNESISSPDAYVCSSADACTMHAQERLLQSYRRCWRDLLRQFCAVQDGPQKDNEGDGKKAALAASLEDIDADLEDVCDVVGLVVGMKDTMESLQRLCAVHRRVRGGHAGSISVVLDDLLDDWQQRADTRDEVESFLDALNSTRGGGSSIDSLEDAQEVFARLYAHAEELQKSLEEAVKTNLDDAVAAATEDADDSMRNELASLREALHDAEAHNHELKSQLQEAQEETQSVLEHQKHIEKLLEDTEGQLEDAKKSLLATKRAAEVRSSEVSSMFDMESKLHESREVISNLSTKIETLMKDVDTKEDEIHNFHRKQKAVKEVLQSVLRSQNTMADDVSDFSEMVNELIDDVKKSQRTDLSNPLRELLVAIQQKASALETSMESRLREQKMWFHTLSSELKAAVM